MLKYSKIVDQILINNTGIYNVYNKKVNLRLQTSFNTFRSEKNIKLTRLYKMLSLISNQKPILSDVRFYYKKKKILKKFLLFVNLNSRNFFNTSIYFSHFYAHLFDVYYDKKLTCSEINSNLSIFVDNYQLFLKTMKFSQRTQIKFTFNCDSSELYFKKRMNNLFLINF